VVSALWCCKGQVAVWEPGDPLPGLSPNELERFYRGQELFHREFTAQEGLGPLFNQSRCSSCHDLPVLGGTGVESVLKATQWISPDSCDRLETWGGEVFQDRATPLLQARGVMREVPPSSATAIRVLPPSLLGLGLAEAIPDSTLRALADPQDRDGDGISGRLGLAPSGNIGRFGVKANHATLRDFISSALLVEMGLTTSLHPLEERPSGRELPAATDPAPDPEISDEELALLVDFVRFLAPPPRRKLESRVEEDSVRRGQKIFELAGCHKCHVPELRTARTPPGPLSGRSVAFYSDFLLHDLGLEPGLCSPGSPPSEVRTARLAGLRFRASYLHDGRATSLEEAIALHGGEARSARDFAAKLSPGERRLLLKFLESL
jgi:CxxC motif-containing protein (DUF1111 family)